MANGHSSVKQGPKKPKPTKTRALRAGVRGKLLAFSPASSSVVIAEVKKGFQYNELESLREKLDVPLNTLAAGIRVNERTLARRKTEGRLTPEESERVYRMERLFSLAVDLLRDESRARAWFTSPKKALAGRTPLEYAETEVGAREVEDLIGRVRHGVFA